MSRTVKSVIIAAAALVLLAAALVILLLTAPKDESSGSEPSSNVSLFDDEGDDLTVITDYESDTVLKLAVTNENGGYTLTRAERNGEYYWQTDGLANVQPDEDAIKRNIEIFTQLAGVPVAEHLSEEDLKEYGLNEPTGAAELEFDDGTRVTITFGRRNPLKTQYVYCTIGDGNVYQADHANVMEVFSDARSFAQLKMTEELEDGQPERIVILRQDLGTDVELRYMSELDNVSEDITVTTTNSYRFAEPIRAEVDAERASGLYTKLSGLEMYACEFLEKSEENLIFCGLDMPFTTVEFTCGGGERLLSLGNEFTKKTDYGDVQCYYAIMDDVEGIFSIEKRNAPWYTFEIFGSVSKRPISPYIYGCESVEIATPEGEFKFDINADDKSVTLNGSAVDSYKFRQLYSKLIGEVGDELYIESADGEPTLRVRFNYRGEYAALYGGTSDELCFSDNDGRRYAVSLNGNTLFKVNQLYVRDIIDGVSELVNN